MVFWQLVDALGWLTVAVMIGGTAWAAWYLVADTRSRRRSRVTRATTWQDPSLRDRIA